MLTGITTKIRSLIEDLGDKTTEAFEYTSSKIFTLLEDKKITITKVLKNDLPLGSGETYTFDDDTSEITITADLVSTDIISVQYTYYKYSDSEIKEYIRASLVWLSIFNCCSGDYELETDDIVPTPDNKTLDLISIISSILINPDWVSKRIDRVSKVDYPRTMTKNKQIEYWISKFNRGDSVTGVIQWNGVDGE